MAEEDTINNKIQPSLPPNYVSILQLQQQWLDKKHKQEQEAKLKQVQIQTHKKEKELMIQELAQEKQIGDTQQHQTRGNYVKSTGNMERFSLGRLQGSNYVEKSHQGRFQGSNNVGKSYQGRSQGSDNVEKTNLERFQGSDHVEKSSLGRVQGFDQSGYEQRRDYNRNCGKGGFNDKGKGKIGEVRERRGDSVLHQVEERGDFERCDSKCRRSGSDGRGGVEMVMCLHVVAVEEDENVGMKKIDDGFRSGLRSNVGDLCANNDDSENSGKGEILVEGLARGKKVDDGVMRIGPKKNGLFRPSRVNKVALSADFGDSVNLGRREGVEETEEVIEGKENARISDVGVAIEVGNVERGSRWGYKKNRNKKGLFRNEFGRDTEQGQENGRDVREENRIQLDLKKGTDGKTGEGSGYNIGDVEAGMGVTIEVMNVEHKSRGGSQKNRNKKGLSRSEFGRGTEQGQRNGRDMEEDNGIQLDLKKGNVGQNREERSGDNLRDVKDVADMGVTTEVIDVEQDSKRDYKKNPSWNGTSRSEFGKGTELEQENKRGMGEENVIPLVLKKENGGNIREMSGDIMGDGGGEAEKGLRLKQWKHRRVSVGRRTIGERMMDNTRCEWIVKGDRAGAKIIKNTIGEKSRTYESEEKIPVIVSEINEKPNLCSNGSQINNCDDTLNFGFQGNKMEKKENQKQELFGEHEDKSLLITNEVNGERAKFRDKTGGNGSEGFSRENTRRDFKELSLNSQRVGNGRKNFQMPGHKWRSKKNPQFGDNQRNTEFVWVKKGDIDDADIPET